MIGDRQTIARFQSDFYRNNYHKMLKALLILCFVILMLIGAIIYLILKEPARQYYATTTQGQIIPMIQIHS